MTDGANDSRDVFLSHRGVNKPFVRRLAADIESEPYGDRYLSVWLDEAEIRPGQSIPGMINYGLECSRFIVLVMTPAYFTSESGWTDAEWHAALHRDPDNRQSRIIPVLAEDCPYIPILLRHMLSLDLRGRSYDRDFRRLLTILRDEPLPRPVTYRGQLIRANGRIDRSTLVAERAVPAGDPDPVVESLSCNLLPVERMPPYLYEAPIHASLRGKKHDGSESFPTKTELRSLVHKKQLESGEDRPRTPAFRVIGDRVITFHDIESEESLLASVIDQDAVDSIRVTDAVQDEDDRRIVISLLNMSLTRHLLARGLCVDDTRRSARFYFPADNGKARTIMWKPFRKHTPRTVTKPYTQSDTIVQWLHQAAYIKVVFLASRFFVQITPTWLLTNDGETVKGGSEVGRVINRWTARERNLSVLYHVRFWTTVLRRGPGPLISVRVGEQTMDIATVPAFVSQAYGIAEDHKDVLEALDEAAPRIALEEENLEVETRSGTEEDADDSSELADDDEDKDE